MSSYAYRDSNGREWAPVKELRLNPWSPMKGPHFIPWEYHERAFEAYLKSKPILPCSTARHQAADAPFAAIDFERLLGVDARSLPILTWQEIDRANELLKEKSEQDFVDALARSAHMVNRVYRQSPGDHSQVPWDDAPEWQKESCREGVRAILDGRVTKPSDSHESWLKHKLEDGWTYGPVKDPEKKQHPCMVPYEELPQEQKLKDQFLLTVVMAFSPHELQRKERDDFNLGQIIQDIVASRNAATLGSPAT